MVPRDPEMCTKMLKKLREKLRPNFHSTTPGYSIVKIAHLEVFLASKPSRRSITAAKRKEKEEKERRKKNSKTKMVVKRDANGKKGKLWCRKCIFYQIKANLAEI